MNEQTQSQVNPNTSILANKPPASFVDPTAWSAGPAWWSEPGARSGAVPVAQSAWGAACTARSIAGFAALQGPRQSAERRRILAISGPGDGVDRIGSSSGRMAPQLIHWLPQPSRHEDGTCCHHRLTPWEPVKGSRLPATLRHPPRLLILAHERPQPDRAGCPPSILDVPQRGTPLCRAARWFSGQTSSGIAAGAGWARAQFHYGPPAEA